MSGLKRPRARILYYVPCLEVGGVEKSVHNLALALPRDRFDPVVAWSCYWGPLGDSLRNSGVPICQLPFNRPRQLAETVSGIRAIAPDIFHSFSYRKDDHDVRAAREAAVPTVLTYRGDVRFWDEAQTLQSWESFRNQGTDRITVCSDAVASVVRHVEGVPDAKIRVIHHGVKFPRPESAGATIREELGIASGDPLIGYVGNYRPEKGHETLLRAFRQVLDAMPSARLICCGGGQAGIKQRLETMAVELGLDGRAMLLDLQMDVDRIYRGLDVYVHPSDTEGFSNTVLEAMAHRLPIVATRTGGNSEAVRDRETGLLVLPGDPASLAAAMVALLSNPDFAGRLGHAAHARVRDSFQFKTMVDAYAELYEEELAKH